jgi:hypothetical protein
MLVMWQGMAEEGITPIPSAHTLAPFPQHISFSKYKFKNKMYQ